MPFLERRKDPRVNQSVPCQVTLGPSRFSTQTKNISCGGALCPLPQGVPLMTKLKVDLKLPGGLPGIPTRRIRLTGVVVRQEPLVQPGDRSLYLTAIYFSEIKKQDRRLLAEFVLKSMLTHGHRGS